MAHDEKQGVGRWTVIGLIIALFGIPAITSLARLGDLADPRIVATREISILVLTGVLLAIVLRGERLPLGSIGLRFDRMGRSVWHALVLSVVLIVGAVATLAAYSMLGISYGEGAKVAPSLALTTLTVVRAGIAEEIFFRGFAFQRIETMSGSTLVAAIVTIVLFAAFHFSGGLPGMFIALVLGAVLTAYYVWKRDLLAAIIAHFLVDFVPNVLLPLLGVGE